MNPYAVRQEAIEEAIRQYIADGSSEGMIEVHRNLPGPHIATIGQCWCEPFVIDLAHDSLANLGDFDGAPLLQSH